MIPTRQCVVNPYELKSYQEFKKKLIEKGNYDLLNDLTDMVFEVWQLIEKGEVK